MLKIRIFMLEELVDHRSGLLAFERRTGRSAEHREVAAVSFS
jgi:hypothetical protein